jgi:chemotaxis signal transduction protein
MAATGDHVAATLPEPARVAPPRIALRPQAGLPWLLLPQGVPLEVLIDAVGIQVPNTQPWFDGVVSQRGNLLPVFDLAKWAGLKTTSRDKRQIVVVGLGTRHCALLTASAPMLIRVDTPIPSSASDVGTLSPFLRERYATPHGDAYEFDIERWLTVVSQQVPRSATVITR